MKFYQVDELLGQVQINFHISPAFINLLALVFAALVINHFFACVWYIGARAAPGERIFTNWGTASLCPRSWLGDLKHRGLCVDGAVRFRVDIMYVGERESVDNQIVRMASADAEGFGEAGGAGDAACLGSGVHRRDYDAALELKSPRNPLALREETKEPPEDVDESRVTYKFDDQGDEPLLVDFEFS